jgi:AraC family transcriptional regulator
MAQPAKSKLKEPVVREGKALLIAGLQNHYTPQTVSEIPQLWQRLMPYLGKISGQVGSSTYGVGFNNNERGFDYIAGVEVSNLSAIPAEFSKLTIPAQKYYVFVHEGHVSEIPKTIGAIINEWVPASGYKFAALPSMLERYGENFSPQTGTGDMEIWLPAAS